MILLNHLHYPLLVFCALSANVQYPQDPLKNFCRRYGHQTAIIDRKLYIDGGWIYANPITSDSVPVMSILAYIRRKRNGSNGSSDRGYFMITQTK